MRRHEMFLKTREDARRRGDRSVNRAMEVELSRMGYQEPPAKVAPETTQATMTEQAIPAKPKGRGRPPRPRCEHDQIIDRCPDCKTEGV